jgi:hypothetical protein
MDDEKLKENAGPLRDILESWNLKLQELEEENKKLRRAAKIHEEEEEEKKKNRIGKISDKDETTEDLKKQTINYKIHKCKVEQNSIRMAEKVIKYTGYVVGAVDKILPIASLLVPQLGVLKSVMPIVDKICSGGVALIAGAIAGGITGAKDKDFNSGNKVTGFFKGLFKGAKSTIKSLFGKKDKTKPTGDSDNSQGETENDTKTDEEKKLKNFENKLDSLNGAIDSFAEFLNKDKEKKI